MNRCPITYEHCGQERYSKNGLKLLSRSLKNLKDFPYSAKEQVKLATEFAAKLSIQGIQPKLSVRLNSAKELFEVVERGGQYILKSPNPNFDELPQNEDLTMRLAKLVNIEVPFHGMIYNKDGTFSYFIKRFDRIARGRKVAVEDFSQLEGFTRETKYESSMEKVADVLKRHCTFPEIEKLKLFRLVLFNFLVGNEDMHLKNFTLIRRKDKVELSPSYDLVNSTIILPTREEVALPIRGKKSKLTRSDLVDYYGIERLGISKPVIVREMENFQNILPLWKDLIVQSFLSKEMQTSYIEVIQQRSKRLF